MFNLDDGPEYTYGHPEMLPLKLKGLREIRCGQCGHEMQVLEEFEEASVPCVQCGQAIVIHGFGLEIPADNGDTSTLKAELPTTVFSYEGRKQQRKEHRLRDLRRWGWAVAIVVIYIAYRIIRSL